MTFYKKGLWFLALFVGTGFILKSLSQFRLPGEIDILIDKGTELSAEITITSKINLENNITYIKLHPFLLSTPKTVMRTTPPKFLTDVKNPCFAIDNNFINIGNINLSYALKMNYEVRCLPYVYIAGKIVRLHTITFIKNKSFDFLALH